ncbi:ammonium transporter Rh type A-like [Gigantopelta aegis]|uniref:ammonium transporter Rh type A-like n=1 Tax=Gigantopelta aegis TaxID=1735272 RepID=UPI001B88AB71|nr:ammonium transporter Rh type A-like [Gigantopelta aegis]
MDSRYKRAKLPVFVITLQVGFILIFAFLSEYDDSAKPFWKGKPEDSPIRQYYPSMNRSRIMFRPWMRGSLKVFCFPVFQDVHVMIFVGFGFLMTYLKRYGFGAVGFNMLVAAFCIQWATIVRGLLHAKVTEGEKFKVTLSEMMSADFAAAAVLISLGAMLGKTNPIKLKFKVLLSKQTFISFNSQASDIGESMYVHVFGAYFGLAVTRFLYLHDIDRSKKETTVYHSELFSMVGTLFLWMYWPSFNSGAAENDEQHRAVLNTYFSLVASVIVSFAISSSVHRHGHIEMDHIQNATLAGGVAVGTCANMPLEPWGALTIGAIAGIISTLGFKYLSHYIERKSKVHDTCGVNNLHGMPGLLAGISGAIMAALATEEKYGPSLYEIFPAMEKPVNTTNSSEPALKSDTALGRSAAVQGGYHQMLALVVTLCIALIGGMLTGFLMRLPILDRPRGDDLFDDAGFWHIPEGFPDAEPIVTVKKSPDVEMDSGPSVKITCVPEVTCF